ncbi:VCBS repeat-containing protein, partial [candidate division KSB1 bacterium]
MSQTQFRTLGAGLFFAVSVLCPGIFSQTIKFTDVTSAYQTPGNTEGGVSAYGHGVIMADINGDGRSDIYISNAVRYADELAETMYVSTADGYQENDQARGVEDKYGWTGSHGICFVDYDNDDDFDIYNATTDDRNRLYRNRGDGYYQDVTDAAGLPLYRIVFPDFDSAAYGYGTRGVTAFDANGDGYMDLLAVNWGPAETRYDLNSRIVIPPQPNEFYLNNGDGTFKTVTNSGLTSPPNDSYRGTQGVTAADVDNDGDMDVLIVHRNYTGLTEDGRAINGYNSERQVPNQLMINDGHGHFSDETIARGLYHAANDANGATFADYDNDGDLDLFVPPKDKTRQYVRVYRNRGDGHFDDVTSSVSIQQWGFSTFFLDADNDGDLDIIAPRTRNYISFYRNDGNGSFSLQSGVGVEVLAYDPRGGAIGDIDDDGDLDFYYADANKDIDPLYSNRLFRNDLKSSNRWLKISGRGPAGDRGGFGAKIWIYDQGHLDDPDHLLTYRQVINSYGYLCQDDPEQHFGLGQRDSVDVKIELLDGSELFMVNAPAKRRLFFCKPSQLARTSGDQSASVGSLAPQPLVLRLLSANGEPVHGAPVLFTSDDATAQFVPSAAIYSDQEGYASVRYRLGFNQTQIVTAQCPSVPDAEVQYTISGVGATVGDIEIIAGNDQQGQAGYALAHPLVVKVTDNSGQILADAAVHFQVMGDGLVNGRSFFEVVTDADGLARVQWTLGAQPSATQTVDAFPLARPTLLAHFQATSFGPPAKLICLSSSSLQGTVNSYLADSLAAQVRDTNDHPLRGAFVSFAVTAGGGRVNDASEVTVASDARALAKVRWRLGQKAGALNQTVRISSAGLTGSPTSVNATALAGHAAVLVKVSGDNQIGEINRTLAAPLVVAVQDSFANAVARHSVQFTLVAGDGSFGGQSAVTIQTDENGYAASTATLGAAVGNDIYHFSVTAAFEGEPLAGSPLSFTASGQWSSATRLTLISASVLHGTVGCMLPDSVRVRVYDDKTPVSDQPVVFTILSGSSRLPGAATELTMHTNAAGFAAVAVQLAEKPDTTILRIQANNGVRSLDPGAIDVRIVAEVGPPDPATSLFTAPDSLIADGATAGTLQIRLCDALGNPVAGQNVTFSHSGIEIHIVQPLSATDSDGRTCGLFTADAVGRAIIAAEVERQTVLTVAVDCLPGPAARAYALGDHQRQNPEKELPQPIGLLVTDAWDHPLAGEKVTFTVMDGGGQIIESQPMVTNSSGQALARWQLGAIVGEQHARAVVSGLDTTVVFTAIAQPQGSAQLAIVSGDRQIVRIGETAPDSLVVELLDQAGHPLPNVVITFSVVSSSGDDNGAIMTTARQNTDAGGRARAVYRAGQKTGIQRVRAESFRWGSAEFTFWVESERTFTLIKMSRDGQTARPLATLSCMVKVLDVWGRPAPDEMLIATVKKGGGSVLPDSIATTSPGGVASIAWRLGACGEQLLQVRPAKGQGSLVFTALVNNNAPTFTQSSRAIRFVNIPIGEELLLPLEAKDKELDTINYTVHPLPDGASLAGDTMKRFNWKPSPSQKGAYDLIFVAADSYGAADSLSLHIDVTEELRYFAILQRQPEQRQLDIAYDESVLFAVTSDSAAAVPAIAWSVEGEPIAAGPSCVVHFTASAFPAADFRIFAHL